MSDLDDIDFFRSGAVLKDPYPYYEQLRSHCPVHREPHEGVVMVTSRAAVPTPSNCWPVREETAAAETAEATNCLRDIPSFFAMRSSLNRASPLVFRLAPACVFLRSSVERESKPPPGLPPPRDYSQQM